MNIKMTNEKIADNIRAERNRANITQEEVAIALNISRQTYSEYEKTAENCKMNTLLKLAELFNCKIDGFFKENT